MGNRDNILEIRRKLGARIRELREGQHLSQYKFSAMIEIERTYLIDVEKGRRNVSIDNLAKISAGLGVTLEELFHGVEVVECYTEHVSSVES